MTNINITLKPYRGESGYLCLPLVDNITTITSGQATGKHDDWQIINCPKCGVECYLSPDSKRLLDNVPQLQGVCTVCALKAEVS